MFRSDADHHAVRKEKEEQESLFAKMQTYNRHLSDEDYVQNAYLQGPRPHALSLTVKTNSNNFINILLLRTFISFLTFCHGCVLSTVLLKK